MTTIDSNKERYEKLYSQLQEFTILDIWATLEDAHHYGYITEKQYKHEKFLFSDIAKAKNTLEKYLRRAAGIDIIKEKVEACQDLDTYLPGYVRPHLTARDLVEEYFPMFDLVKDSGNGGMGITKKFKLTIKYADGNKDVYEMDFTGRENNHDNPGKQ